MKKFCLTLVIVLMFSSCLYSSELDDLMASMDIQHDEVENVDVIKDKVTNEGNSGERQKLMRVYDEKAALLKVYVDSGDKDKAKKIFDELQSVDKAIYNAMNVNFFYPYIRQQTQGKKKADLGFVIGFVKDDYVFFDKVTVNIDGEIVRLSFKNYDVLHDLVGTKAIESIVFDPISYKLPVGKVMNSEKTIVRCSGLHGSYDFIVSEQQKAALRRVWRLYELLIDQEKQNMPKSVKSGNKTRKVKKKR